MAMQSRAAQSQAIRIAAADLAKERGSITHQANGEELEYRQSDGTPSYIASFTKGLPHHTETGLLINPVDFRLFVKGINSGDPQDFLATPLGPAVSNIKPAHDALTTTVIPPGSSPNPSNWLSQVAQTKSFDLDPKDPEAVGLRGWESAAAGLTFDLEGPDAQSVTMPPAPRLDSPELAAEMVEIYAQALLRDTHVSHFRETINNHGPIDIQRGSGSKSKTEDETPEPKEDRTLTGFNVTNAIELLGLQSEWFELADKPQSASPQLSRRVDEKGNSDPKFSRPLTDSERARLRPKPSKETIFRGFTPYNSEGPYLSQFLLIGNSGISAGNQDRSIADGIITYGSIRIDQRVRVARPTVDYMTSLNEYIDVQNAAAVNGTEDYVHSGEEEKGGFPAYRFITTPRDLATYVHYDALYEAYLNACLIMLGLRVPLDPGLPFLIDDIADHQAGFAQFGGPHILTLVTEVATRALKAVRFQKFNTHRRLRPEALAARIEKFPSNSNDIRSPFAPVRPLFNRLSRKTKKGKSILDWVQEHNSRQNSAAGNSGGTTTLLPMAFPEGSPMHPSYGAGHATVAGACVTILKAFFDSGTELYEEFKSTGQTDAVSRPICYEPTEDGRQLRSLLEAPESKGKEKGGIVRSLGFQGADQYYLPETPLQKQKPIAPAGFRALTVEGELNKLAANISIGRDWAGVHYYTDYIESIRMGEKIAIGLLEEQKLTYRENFTMTVPLFDGGTIKI